MNQGCLCPFSKNVNAFVFPLKFTNLKGFQGPLGTLMHESMT